MNKLLYRPIGLGVGALSGFLAGLAVKQVWRLAAGDDEAPEPTDEERSWREVLFAAALQGAVFATVKALVERGGASGVRRLTGSWPK